MNNYLVISSVEDGLDFACNLFADGIMKFADRPASVTTNLLQHIAQYIEFRYVGEYLLALEYLSDIGNMLEHDSFRSEQFWAQISWIAQKIELEPEVIQGLNIPITST